MMPPTRSDSLPPNGADPYDVLSTHTFEPAAGGSPHRRAAWTAFSLLVLTAAALACYGNSLRVPFLFDDLDAIVENRTIRRLWPLTEALSPPPGTTCSGRPLLNASFAVNYAVGGLDPFGYHVFNICIHVACAGLMFGLLRRLFRLPAGARPVLESADGLALSIALLWLVHPLQTESVTYVVQRAESLAGLFYLAAGYAFVRALSAASRGLSWQVASVALCGLGALCKEVLATAPFVFYAMDALVVCGGQWVEPLRRRRGFYVALLLSLAPLFIILAQSPRGESAGFGAADAPPWWQYAMAQPGVILLYLKLALVPLGLCLDYGLEVPQTWHDFVPQAVAIGLLLFATARLATKGRPVALAGIWFLAILAPTSSIVPIADLAFEHRMYLPLAAVVAACVLAVHAATGGASPVASAGVAATTHIRGLRCGMVVAAVCVLAALTHLRNRDYATERSIWADTARKRPANARALYNLGKALQSEGDLAGAETAYRAAIEAGPNYDLPYVGLGLLLSDRGEHESGLALVRRGADMRDSNAFKHYNLGIVLARLGRKQEAAEQYRLALARDEAFADPAYNLGNLAMRQGDTAEAERFYREALSREPEHVQANFNLAGLLLARGENARAAVCLDAAFKHAVQQARTAQAAGRRLDAVENFQLAVQVRPDDADARLALAEALRAAGRAVEADAEAREAQRRRPSHEGARRFIDAGGG